MSGQWKAEEDDPVTRWVGRPSSFDDLNDARVRAGLDPLPSNEVLNRALLEAGFTACEGKPYLEAVR